MIYSLLVFGSGKHKLNVTGTVLLPRIRDDSLQNGKHSKTLGGVRWNGLLAT